MKRTMSLLALAMWTACLPVTAVLAQEAGADAAEIAETRDLAKKAQFLKQKFEELLASMLDVARLLDATEPKTAEILRRTVEHAQRELVAEKMDAVRKALREGLDQAAQASQGEVVSQLGTMLRILEGAATETSETDKKLEERRAALDEVDRLLKDQQAEEELTRAAAHAEDIDRKTQQLLDALKALAERQRELMAETGRLPADNEELKRLGELRDAVQDLIDKQEGLNRQSEKAALGKLPILGEVQKQLAEQAGELNTAIEKAAKDETLRKAIDRAGGNPESLDGAARNAASAGKEMTRASTSLGESHKGDARLPQRQAAADLRAVRRAIDEAMDKIASESKTGELASVQDELADEAGSLDETMKNVAEKAAIDPESLGQSGEQGGQQGGEHGRRPGGQDGGQQARQQGGQQPPQGDLQKAAGHMEKAAEEITAQDKATATDEQKKAMAELQEKLEQAAKLRERAMAKAKEDLDAAKQRQIASDAGKLAETMKQGTDGKPMGGQQSVEGASKSAGSAAGKMSQGQTGSANSDQQKAVEQLRQAQQQLQEEIAELEERSKAERLAKIEQRLEKVLEQQKRITTRTRKTWDKRAAESSYDREAAQTLLDDSRQEGKLADEVAAVRRMLVDEGSTIIFPEILGDVREDLASVRDRLKEKDPGPLTQSTQQEIERTLQELIDAVRDELSKGPGRRKGGGGGMPGGGGGKQPLIPPIAELRMLRLKQVRILSETRQLERQLEVSVPDGDAKAKAKVLSKEQQRVRKLTDQIKEKMGAPGRVQG
ncbi:MAG: hypothetical protein KGY81_02865 [Phycisphaerae bacterium]|nr:hypothetical protein [Phycisphaerae bacterium]